jgi:hypothetical protein
MRVGAVYHQFGWIALFAILCFEQKAAAQCRIVDRMPQYWNLVSESANESPQDQVAGFHSVLDLVHTDLYSKTGLGFETDEQLDRAILKALRDARQNREIMEQMSTKVRATLDQELVRFKKTFPDFQCNFVIYLVPSLGNLDGAGRVVDGQPALVFGVDSIASEFSTQPLQLPVFMDHELFHRYHSQVAGFSDDKGQQEVLWRGLWAEGLATYVSMVLNPPATMQDALFLPKDLVSRASPIRSVLAKQLAVRLDFSDPEVFRRYFSYHANDVDGVPPRSGYYIGALVAQQLAQQNTLQQLAHLQDGVVRRKLAETLDLLAR